jgi:hypothetical protein
MTKYIGYDKTATQKNPALEKLVTLCKTRWGAQNLGTFVVREIRGGKPGAMSVHSTGRACDLLIKDKAKKLEAIEWFTRPDVVAGLGIQELHVYDDGKYGKGWRISRKELGGKPGWKQWTATDNGGSAGGAWLHLEIDYTHATAESLVAAWKLLPKP